VKKGSPADRRGGQSDSFEVIIKKKKPLREHHQMIISSFQKEPHLLFTDTKFK
jgi:hypothetical protein